MNHVGSSVNLHVVQDGKILLLRRISKRWMDGKLQIPGGHTEPGESPLAAVLREAQEELGLALNATDVEHVATVAVKDGENEYFALQFRVVDTASLQPTVMEPEKCNELVWASVADLPSDTITLFAEVIAKVYVQGQSYIEVGY